MKCRIICEKRKEPHIYIPDTLLEDWMLEDGITLTVGTTSTMVECLPSPTDDLILTSFLPWSHALHDRVFHILVDRLNAGIGIGPITAILINKTAGVLDDYAHECHRFFHQNGGLLYLLPVSSFLQKDGTGLLYSGGDWEACSVPSPCVLYNRIPSRKLEKTDLFKRAVTCLEKAGGTIFNTRFLSKSEVDQALNHHPLLQDHIPASATGVDELEGMLSTYGDVFIKNIHGSKGRNIIRVTSGDGWEVRQNSFPGDSHQTFKNYRSLEKKVRAWCRNSTYLIQETIPFCQFNGRPLDFRFLCHRIGQEWTVLSSVARVAGDGEFVSNVDRGGQTVKPRTILNDIFPVSKGIYENMKAISLSTAVYLSEMLDGHFSEFGIDLGIDADGKPWIIEVNSKPSKLSSQHSEAVRPSVRGLYQHSLSIWKEEEEEK
jgi:YheC/D like ATP-grasp